MKTPTQLFHAEVTQLQAARRCSFDEAYTLTRLTNRVLYSEMMSNNQAVKQGANEGLILRQRALAAEFTEAVNEVMQRESVDFHTAYMRVKRTRPELLQAVNAASVETAPACGPQVCVSLHLPAGSTQAEVDAAWAANGNKFDPFDAKAVWAAMQAFVMQRDGISAAAAKTVCRTTYTELCQKVTHYTNLA